MVTDFYWPLLGGVEQHVRTLAHALCERGHRVTVATLRVDGLDEHERDGDVDVVRIRNATQRIPGLFDQARPWAPPVCDPVARRALLRLVREWAPSVIHGHDWLARSLLPTPRYLPPLVSTLHYYTLSCAKKTLWLDDRVCPGPVPRTCLRCAADHYGRFKGALTVVGTWVGRRLERRGARAFIAVSAATAHGNQLDVDGESVHVIPNFLPVTDATSGTTIDEWLAELPDEPPFVYVGDFRREKGFDLLLDAYARSGIQRPLVVIGKRWPNSPPTDRAGVHVFENWPNAAVRAAFGRAYAAVVPSRWAEPFGIVAIEAMAAGALVIAADVGGLGGVVRPEVTGLLVPPDDAGALAQAMIRLDIDFALRTRLGARAAAEAEQYSADRIVPQIEAVYDSVTAPSRRTR